MLPMADVVYAKTSTNATSISSIYDMILRTFSHSLKNQNECISVAINNPSGIFVVVVV